MTSYAASSVAHHPSTSATTPTITTMALPGVAQRTNPPALAPPPPLHISFHRADTLHIKQKLHDALGEAGLPYWKALNAYVLGQVGRDELANLVRGWLKGENLQLHNQLLKSLLHNASTTQSSQLGSSPLMHKRRALDAPDFDSDATFIEPRDRVRNWVMGMGGRERERVRRSVRGEDEDGEGAEESPEEWDAAVGRKRKWTVFQSTPAHPPLAQGNHLLPSSHQLASRLAQVAKPYGLDVDPEAARDVGEFMGVGLQTHIGDLLHSVVHLTGRDRPGEDTMRVPLGTQNANIPHPPEDHPVPKPTLQTMQYLFTLAPSLQPQVSPTLYKLGSGLMAAETENATPTPRKVAVTPPANGSALALMPPPSLIPNSGGAGAGVGVGVGVGVGIGASPKKAAIAIQAAAGQGQIDAVSQTLAETGLLKIDKAGHEHQHQSEGDKKREKKHNLHWKYEDPAIILKDLLG